MLVKQHPVDGMLSFDDKLLVRNLRLNLVPGKGVRIKGELSKDGNTFLMKDLSIYKYDTGISLKGFHINIQGTELISNTPISLKLMYEISKKDWVLTGKIGDHSMNKNFESIWQMAMIINMI